MPPTIQRSADEHLVWRPALVAFILVNFSWLALFATGITRTAVVLFVVLYVLRGIGVTAGYHRLLAHRAYKANRPVAFVLAFLGTASAQKGPLWWAEHHRDHHRYTDTSRDPHTPQKGFWYSHIGWIFTGAYRHTHPERVRDLSQYRELRWLDRYDFLPPVLMGAFAFAVGGWSGLVFGFFCSTVLLWHATFAVNSFAHLVGRRRYGTVDTSRNNPVIAFFTLGEGWHNNHHHYPACARQGFRWWEIDPTYGLLRALSWVGLVRDLRQPPRAAISARRLRDGQLDIGRLRQRLAEAAALARDTAPDVADAIAATAERAVRSVGRDRLPATADDGS